MTQFYLDSPPFVLVNLFVIPFLVVLPNSTYFFCSQISTLEYVVIIWLLILTLVMVAVLCNYYVTQKFLGTIHDLYRMIINAMKVSGIHKEPKLFVNQDDVKDSAIK